MRKKRPLPRARAGELDLCRVTFTIPESTVAVMRKVGSGNASLGVRLAAEHMTDCSRTELVSAPNRA